MSKAVLISIQPKYCELIARGKKTIEVRKTRPKLETPFKCYIYMTKSNLTGDRKAYKDRMAGKVIGEIVCDEIANIFSLSKFWVSDELLSDICLTPTEIRKYANGVDKLYAWHISDLVIYDEPKELNEFCIPCEESLTDKTTAKCKRCQYHRKESEMSLSNEQNCVCDGIKPITRPPQSWCYVEEVYK